MQSLTFEPLISAALWLTLAVLAAGVLAAYALRRPAGLSPAKWAGVVVLMTAGAVLPLVVLLNPVWVTRIPQPRGKPTLTVLVDRSASMATADADAHQTRYQAASQIARDCTAELTDRFDVQVRTFADSVTAVEPDALAATPPEGMLTDLAAAIASSLGDPKPAGQAVLLLSDGIHNGGEGQSSVFAAARAARAVGAPIYTKTFGGASAIKDLSLRLHSSQQVAFLGQNVPINLLVKRIGAVNPRVQVSLRHEGREVAKQEATLGLNEEADIPFYVSQNKTGVFRYEASVEPVPGEATAVNNYATFVLRVVDQPIRVLLLEGAPYWDSKFLMRTFTSDPSIELDSIVRVSSGRMVRRSFRRIKAEPSEPPAPAADAEAADPESPPVHQLEEKLEFLTDFSQVLSDRKSWQAYQVIVLGRNAEAFLSEAVLANLRNWLSRESGALVCYRGQPVAQVDQQLDKLLPVRWSPTAESHFRVQMTDRGRTLRWLPEREDLPGQTLAMLPSLASASQPERLKPLAVVLATAADPNKGGEKPVVTYQPFGGGRVVVVEGSGMWRWAFLPPRFKEHEELYQALWQSLLRWLVSSAGLLPGEQFALRTDKVSFSTTEAANALLLVREDAEPPAVELRGDTLAQPRTVAPVPLGDEPGTFRVAFGTLREGRYEVRVAGQPEGGRSASAAFDVRQFIEEQLDLTARPDVMARISSATGGAVLRTADASEIADQFKRHLSINHPERVTRQTAWDRWWVLLTVILLWSVSWGVRRYAGLI